MSKPLTNDQKACISRIARVGWRRARDLELTTEVEKDWRGREAVECCGRRVSEASDDDFAPLMAHFCNLAGDGAAAMNWALKAQTSKRRQAMWGLDRELKKAELPTSYAEKLCFDFFKCNLSQASPEQIKNVIITIRKRGQKEPA